MVLGYLLLSGSPVEILKVMAILYTGGGDNNYYLVITLKQHVRDIVLVGV